MDRFVVFTARPTFQQHLRVSNSTATPVEVDQEDVLEARRHRYI